jgi:hypothetical protein
VRHFFTPVVRDLKSLQHTSSAINNNATKNDNADVFNSNSLDDGIGQELIQGLSSAMQFSTKRDKEDMAQHVTPVIKCEESMIELLIQRCCPSQQNQQHQLYSGNRGVEQYLPCRASKASKASFSTRKYIS